MVAQDEEAEDSDEAEHKPAPEHLANARFRAKADDLNQGETVIMTLADRGILDERGELDEDNDELENVLSVGPWCPWCCCRRAVRHAGHQPRARWCS